MSDRTLGWEEDWRMVTHGDVGGLGGEGAGGDATSERVVSMGRLEVGWVAA